MDYAKIFVSFVLVMVFYLLFGHESIEKLMQDEMAISHSDNEPKIIKAPGYMIKKNCHNVKIYF